MPAGSAEQIVRGPILSPQPNGSVDFFSDGAIKTDSSGSIDFTGAWPALARDLGSRASSIPTRTTTALILPPFLDNHTHAAQFTVRGRFVDGVSADTPEGRLIAGLNRNVFPTEARFADLAFAEATVKSFLDDCLANGVVGGLAWMTVHPDAARLALQILAKSWRVGFVLMNQNCPENLRTNESTFNADVDDLAKEFGERLVLADRFAVADSTELRRRGVELSKRFGLSMTTHLNEQPGEKRLVEEKLYPDAGSYTNVYARDGLLARDAIVAHCIWNTDAEFDLLATSGAAIAHCPVSNTNLNSGVMPLDKVLDRDIPYSICTDVGASETTSLLHEMSHYLDVHRGRSSRATPSEALYRTTLAAAKIAHLDDALGSFAIGKPLSFVEMTCDALSLGAASVDDVISAGLVHGRVIRVTLAGRIAWERR